MSLQRQPDHIGIFVVCLIVGFEVDEVDSLVMRIISGLRKLQPISNHVLINYVGTAKLSKPMCYVHVDICYYINKSV